MATKYVMTPEIREYIRSNYTHMTDKAMGEFLKVPERTIRYWRQKLQLKKGGAKHLPVNPSMDVVENLNNRNDQVRGMSSEQRREFYLDQLRSRPRYKMVQTILTPDELSFYEEKYVEYFSDPDIETLTVTEEDDIHELTMTQIEKMRLQRACLNAGDDANTLANHSRAIKEKDEVILKIKKSLSLERSQRLTRQADTSTNFTNLIRELNNRGIRIMAGEEAAMFRFRMQESINTLIDDGHMRGFDPFELGENFKDGNLPEDYEPPPEIEDVVRELVNGDAQDDEEEVNKKEEDGKEKEGKKENPSG